MIEYPIQRRMGDFRGSEDRGFHRARVAYRTWCSDYRYHGCDGPYSRKRAGEIPGGVPADERDRIRVGNRADLRGVPQFFELGGGSGRGPCLRGAEFSGGDSSPQGARSRRVF